MTEERRVDPCPTNCAACANGGSLPPEVMNDLRERIAHAAAAVVNERLKLERLPMVTGYRIADAVTALPDLPAMLITALSRDRRTRARTLEEVENRLGKMRRHQEHLRPGDPSSRANYLVGVDDAILTVTNLRLGQPLTERDYETMLARRADLNRQAREQDVHRGLEEPW